jgi:carboxymethylenebutenolidase
MSERIPLKSRSGQAFEGVLALPRGASGEGAAAPQKAPAVVVIHEWWGVNTQIESILARFAEEGFVAMAPDLYHGKVIPNGKADDANAAMGALDWRRALDEIAGAVSYVREHPRGNGRVGVVGFCMGGALTFATASEGRGIDAAVPFYGIPGPEFLHTANIEAPILAHFAEHDGWAKPDGARAIQAALTQRGKRMELHVYDAQHAFFNDTRPEVHSPENAKLAWSRTIAFLRDTLRAT